MRLVTLISADRSVSTSSVRFVHGMVPAVQTLIAQGKDRTEAYMSRDAVGEVTGLEPSKVHPTYYPRQLAEVGLVQMTQRGEYGMVKVADGLWRGNASRWIVDEDSYTPKDVPALELETEPYWVDIDHNAVVAAMQPTASTWAKEPEAYRLAMALIHHVGLARVKVDAQQAAEILGKSRVTGWRTLRKLAALEQGDLYRDGWVNLQTLFMDPSYVQTDEKHVERTEAAKTHRWSVFTKAGWEVRDMAKQWRAMLPTLPRPEGLNQEYVDNVGCDSGAKTIRYIRALMELPFATGRPAAI